MTLETKCLVSCRDMLQSDILYSHDGNFHLVISPLPFPSYGKRMQSSWESIPRVQERPAIKNNYSCLFIYICLSVWLAIYLCIYVSIILSVIYVSFRTNLCKMHKRIKGQFQYPVTCVLFHFQHFFWVLIKNLMRHFSMSWPMLWFLVA